MRENKKKTKIKKSQYLNLTIEQDENKAWPKSQEIEANLMMEKKTDSSNIVLNLESATEVSFANAVEKEIKMDDPIFTQMKEQVELTPFESEHKLEIFEQSSLLQYDPSMIQQTSFADTMISGESMSFHPE